ncbi:Multifunctional conjugation protein TraI [Crateriforma conspicua]|nr:Multifunctional conjugation protein TraI [Crateriforma conspicua]
MLIATQGKSVDATQQYFNSVLTQGDYYLGQEINGQWHGRGADILGLGHGTEVTKEQFAALLRGQHPITNEKLTQRTRKDRRPGTDLTFSVPKSVSLAWAINCDERIVDALRETVRECMRRDVEPLMQRRVRDGKHAHTKQRTRTGKLIYADFLHKTSRPVEGRPDPHLHIHAYVINWTEQNGKHYAGEMEEIVRQRPSLQAKFEARLARRLQRELGYGVERVQYTQSGRLKHGWEIKGVTRQTVEKFSRRTEQVEDHARQKGIKDAAKKGKLGVETREQKDSGASIEKLRDEWRSRLTKEERDAFGSLLRGNREDERSEERAAEKSLAYSLEHNLCRQSVAERHQIVGTALEHGLILTPECVEKSLDEMKVIRRSRDVEGANREFITTRAVLEAERDMIAFARDGRGTVKSIGKGEHEFRMDFLNDQQKDAVNHVLMSRDRVTAVTGGAGTGKSSLMEEAANAIRDNGKQVFTFAPSTGAREVLQDKGFENAQTVEYLIRNTEFQTQVRDGVMWIDEAGLLDVRSMGAVFKIAKQQNARVVLSGDTRQHASPRRGEAMRLLEKEAGLNIARVEAIQRQKGRYRDAVKMISRGHEVIDERTGKTGLLAGFDMLDRMGKIKEVSSDERHELLAKQYLKAERKGKSTLVVAPTHAEAGQVTECIRDGLRKQGLLSDHEQAVTQLRSMNLTEAEKGDAATYRGREGVVVQFHQNVAGGIKRGERYTVEKASDEAVELVAADGKRTKSLPLRHADRFEVYQQSEIGLAKGDKVRFSLGGTGVDGKQRISNGRLDEFTGFDGQGNMMLRSGVTVDRDYGHLDLGYVVTSHASQGKDRKLAMAAMGSESLPAINAKQFYVTVSRGSEDVAIYVDDKAKVRRAIEKSGERMSATELIAEPEPRSPTPAYEPMRSAGRAIRGRIGTYRDRLTAWWKQQTAERTPEQTAGRHKAADIARSFGLGAARPERSL